ncbi:MAG TPA: MBL fold metallo-hydrolase [Terriglobia bacterium]|nr:MBL fold metallo-hydrolase [Terriglobia bacterium]
MVSLRISVLGSSSSGNCTFLSTSTTRILLDAGFSKIQTSRRLQSIGESLESIEAIVISHEHSDHVQGLPSLLSAIDVPIYIAEKTLDAIRSSVSHSRVQSIRAGERFTIGDLEISPFSVPHDAVDPLAFVFEADGLKVGHVTDLGYMTGLVIQRLKGCDAIVLESNHDLEMLRSGPYPWHLKQRIMSKHGHLSNDEVGKFIEESFDGHARCIILAHLSESNNHPDLARMVSAIALERKGFSLQNLVLASKTTAIPMIVL